MGEGDVRPSWSVAKSTREPKGYPLLLWCILDITVHRWPCLACTATTESTQVNSHIIKGHRGIRRRFKWADLEVLKTSLRSKYKERWEFEREFNFVEMDKVRNFSSMIRGRRGDLNSIYFRKKRSYKRGERQVDVQRQNLWKKIQEFHEIETCSMRFLTAMAGVGSPCADVALCTDPETGIRYSPDRFFSLGEEDLFEGFSDT